MRLLTLIACLLAPWTLAQGLSQSCGFSSGKSLFELRASLHERTPSSGIHSFKPLSPKHADEAPPRFAIFLPRWSAEELPFFCKIEHNWAKVHGRAPVKFRLGSVDYVDWLEGKSWDKTRIGN